MKNFKTKPTIWGVMALCASAGVCASPLPLSTGPSVGSGKYPAPNVIVSVDDSGSMSGNGGMVTLRAALLDTFTEANIPDGSIRLAWMSMTACPDIPCSNAGNNNKMRVWDQTHRDRFRSWASSLSAVGGTPSHSMLYRGGTYLQSSRGLESPWAEIPGTKEGTYLSCRRAYNVFLSDGGWNQPNYLYLGTVPDTTVSGIGNSDGTNATLPDGKGYIANDPQNKIYSDDKGAFNKVGSSYRSYTTLADLAHYFWKTDLQPDIPSEVHPRYVISSNETVSYGTRSVTFEPYWNPKNDPATWQHMTIYSIGFMGAANIKIPPLTFNNATDTTWSGNAFNALATGSVNWPDPDLADSTSGSTDSDARRTELWHMALNSRGKFIPAPTADTLAPAFKEILNEILVQNAEPLSSIAVSSTSTRKDSAAFVTGYETTNWTGHVTGYKVAGGVVDTSTELWGTYTDGSGATKQHTTASILDQNAGSRSIWTTAEGLTVGSGGSGFAWANLHASQKAALNVNPNSFLDDGQGEQRLEYIRGDRSKEDSLFRTRESLLGDIVNSQLWYAHGNAKDSPTRNASRPDMLYVGANDGMLHAFSTIDGIEKFAYVPKGVIPKLPKLTSANYSHQYYVDGSPFTRDVEPSISAPTYKTYLAGFLGGGGKGYFILDVTNPLSFITGSIILDRTEASDGTAVSHPDPDMGHIFNPPVVDQYDTTIAVQFSKLNDGKWALITGNGYNSANEKPVLYIQYLDSGYTVKKIVADNTVGNGNGLSAPQLVDVNADGKVDYAYAGDLKGNLWRFDLSDANPSQWSASTVPIFTTENHQPITAAPAYARMKVANKNVVGLLFATGQNLTDADRKNTDIHYVYSIYDEYSSTVSSPMTASDLKKLEAKTVTGGYATGKYIDSYETTKGWYFSLPTDWAGARVVTQPMWVYGTDSTFELRFVKPAEGGDGSTAPDEESCSPSYTPDTYYRGLLDLSVGNPYKPIDASCTGSCLEDPTNPKFASKAHLFDDGTSGVFARQIQDENTIKCVAVDGTCDDINLSGYTKMNPSWRNVR